MKFMFEFYNEVLDREEVETIHVHIVDESKGLYRLDNIPFFVRGFASDDIVRAEEVDHGFKKVIELVEKSGNSTVNLIFLDKANEESKKSVLQELVSLGGEYEGMEENIKATTP